MNKKNKTKKILFISSFSLLIILFLSLIFLTRDSKIIVEISDFIKADTKVLYITKNTNKKYPTKILNKYSVDILNVDYNKLNIFEKKKVRNIANNDSIEDILIIYQNGHIIGTLNNYKTEEEVNEFFSKKNIIPEKIVDNVEEIVKESEKILDNEYSIIYIPYMDHESIEKQDRILKEISEKYLIDYKKIDAYLLSKKQQYKINKTLEVSDVEDQIVVLVKENKIIANIRGIHRKNTYIETFYEANFINELENKLNELDYEDFKLELTNNEKSIILLGTNKSKDYEEVFNLLNQMTYSYDIEINYINLKNNESEIYKKVNEKLTNIGYSDAFSLPLVVIVESNKILGYAIGKSNEEYFLDLFIENGVIKGEIVNE